MFKIFNDHNLFFNEIINHNSKDTLMTNNNIPISNKYFITITNNDEYFNLFYNYIFDDSRSIEYPFIKNENIDYHLSFEKEQFYNIDIYNSNILELDNQLTEFINIINESNADVTFLIDINYFINFLNIIMQKKIPNHLMDFILYKLNNNINNIFIIDQAKLISENNMFCFQLKLCLKNYTIENFNLNNKIKVFRKTIDSVVESVYWNYLHCNYNIDSICKKIRSPIDEFDFITITNIENQESFIIEIQINDCIYKNLFETKNSFGIKIEPLDRFLIEIDF